MTTHEPEDAIAGKASGLHSLLSHARLRILEKSGGALLFKESSGREGPAVYFLF
jgi:hypothetical protein